MAELKNNYKLPQEGTDCTAEGESLTGNKPVCPTYSGGGKVRSPKSTVEEIQNKEEKKNEAKKSEEKKNEEKKKEDIEDPFARRGLQRTPPTSKKPPSPPTHHTIQINSQNSQEDQISVVSNAVGRSTSKKLVQQAFHPSLFLARPRLGSAGNNSSSIPVDQSPTPVPCSPGPKTPQPPTWQRVPTSRNTKKRKLSSSPDPVKTSNRFAGLVVDLTEKETGQKTIKPIKPPPIILYGIEDLNLLTELLKTVAEKEQFTYKIINKNQLRISSVDIDTYKKLMALIREKGLIGHTFNRKDQRCYRIVIRNLHPTTPIDVIKEEIESTGNTVAGEIINAKYGPKKIPTSTFFVNLAPGPNNKAVKELKYIFHQSIIIEDPRKRKSIVQCQRCQQYGHSKNYCMRPYRCVKCGQSHKTSECEKRDRNTPAQCALCNGPHPANYKGCEVYKEILARKNKPKIYKGDRNEQVTGNQAKHFATHHPPGSKDNSDKPQQKTYAEAMSDNTKDSRGIPDFTRSNTSLEQILLKQSEKFDTILQQMSTLMSLMVKLVERLSPK